MAAILCRADRRLQALVEELLAGAITAEADSSSDLVTFAPAEVFGTLVHAQARRHGAHGARRLVVLGDGAPWIWNLTSLHVPGATGILTLRCHHASRRWEQVWTRLHQPNGMPGAA